MRNLIASAAFVALIATTSVSPTASYAAKETKAKKIKLESLKPGKVQLDSRLGYVIVRVGPKTPAKSDVTPFGMMRIDSETQTLIPTSAYQVDKNLYRTVSVGLNPGRSFADSNGLGTYIMSVYPGRWVISAVGSTCMSLGTYSFDAKAGEIVDLGILVTGRENGESNAPELSQAKLSQDLIDFGVAVNIVMSETIAIRPAADSPIVPKEFSALPMRKAELQADYRFDNSCAMLINRAASLPAIGHQPPMTQDQAKEAIKAINPPEKPKPDKAGKTTAAK
jgi:hypothetical protein